MKRLLLVIAALILGVDILACTTAVVSAGASADGRPMLWKQRDAPDPYNVIAHIKGGKYDYSTAVVLLREDSSRTLPLAQIIYFGENMSELNLAFAFFMLAMLILAWPYVVPVALFGAFAVICAIPIIIAAVKIKKIKKESEVEE